MTRLVLHHRPFLVVAAVCGAVLGALHQLLGLDREGAVLVGWCLAILIYAAPTLLVMRRATPEALRRDAAAPGQEGGEAAVLAASVAAAVASLVAVAWFLAVRGSLVLWEAALPAATIGLSWAFIHLIFAVRYAQAYWLHGGGGIEFPGQDPPVFDDFLYLAFTIGMTFQTSDVAFATRATRRLALAHAMVSILFNVVIIAVAVNLAAGLVA